MVMDVFDRSAYADIFQQVDERMFHEHMLKDIDTIRKIVQQSKACVVVCKPLHENQYAKRYLEKIPELKIIWLYRNYNDSVNSSVRRWNNMLIRIEAIVKDPSNSGWWGDELPKDKIELVRALYNSNMTQESAYALMWFLRHSFFFDLGLSENQRVRIYRYEEMVSEPAKYFSQMFEYCRCPFSTKYVNGIHANSVNKNPPVRIDPRIEKLCQEMTKKLDRQVSLQHKY